MPFGDTLRQSRRNPSTPIITKVSSVSRGVSKSKSDVDILVMEERLEPLEDAFWMRVALGLLVFCEAIVIGAEVESSKSRNSAHAIWYILKSMLIFMWLFLIFARLYQGGRSSCGPWIIFDSILTILAIIDVWFLSPLIDDSGITLLSVPFDRVLRILMVIRLFRLFSVLRWFGRLRRLSDGLIDSLHVSSSALVMLFFVLYSTGVYMTIIVGHTCDSDYASWAECNIFFGSVYKSMFTLFQLMTLDDWGMEIARPVLEEKVWLWFLIMPFFMVTTFGLLNIIVGVVVERSLKAADDQRRIERKKEEDVMRENLEHVKTFFVRADQDGNGLIDMDEFLLVLQNREFRSILKKLALPTDNPSWLFDVFDCEEKGAVSIQEFIQGLFKFREQPNPLDMHTALMQIHGLTSKMQHMESLILMLLSHHGIKDPMLRKSNRKSAPTSFATRSGKSTSFTRSSCGSSTGTEAKIAIGETKEKVMTFLQPQRTVSSCWSSLDETKLSPTMLRQTALKAPRESEMGCESKSTASASLAMKTLRFPEQLQDLHLAETESLQSLQAQLVTFEGSIRRCFDDIRNVQHSLQAKIALRLVHL